MAVPAPKPMTVDAFLAWLEAIPDEVRYELVSGEAVAMSPERSEHNLVKTNIAIAFRQSVDAGKLKCQVYGDGMLVRVDDHTAYGPDATVRCGEPIPRGATTVPDPLIVVEVQSPSTFALDTGVKLAGYFRVPSIAHYLIVRTDRTAMIHHRRSDASTIETRIVTEGLVTLDPPGITFDLDSIYE